MSVIYKACKNSISTLELLLDSRTNEHREYVVDPNFAKFRTNKVKVVSIVNPETKEQLDKDYSMYDPIFRYTVGKVIEAGDFNCDINKVCAPGIHYFKTYDAALSWYYHYHEKISGKYIGYYENGQKKCEYNYTDRQKEGKEEGWYSDGQKEFEKNYKNGQEEGKQEWWYKNGQKESEYNYTDGQKEGKEEGWYKNGQKEYEYNYTDGQKEEKQEEWYDNGQKRCEYDYKNGQPEGKQEYWYNNGEKKREENYTDGILTNN